MFFAHHMHIWQKQVGNHNMLLRDIINVIYSIKYIASNVYGQDMLYRLKSEAILHPISDGS